jgi:starvation-inducible DNA-binding protein
MALELDTEIDFVNIGLTNQIREQVIGLLNTLLADEHLLYVRTRNYHWNIEGPHFITLHELFEDQYNEIQGLADEIAERARMLGGTPIGTMRAFLDNSRLTETPGEVLNAREMLARLLEDHESIVNYLRNDIQRCTDELNDEGTADLLIATLRNHEKTAWMLRAHLGEASL